MNREVQDMDHNWFKGQDTFRGEVKRNRRNNRSGEK